MAEQQGKYLAKELNAAAKAEQQGKPPEAFPAFKYRHLGSMALVGAPWPLAVVSLKETCCQTTGSCLTSQQGFPFPLATAQQVSHVPQVCCWIVTRHSTLMVGGQHGASKAVSHVQGGISSGSGQ